MDAELGVMVNPAFNDYKLPGTLEIPELIPIIDDGDQRNAVIGLPSLGIFPAAARSPTRFTTPAACASARRPSLPTRSSTA